MGAGYIICLPRPMAWAKMIEELKKKQPSTLGRGKGYAIWWIIYQLVDGNMVGERRRNFPMGKCRQFFDRGKEGKADVRIRRPAT